MPESRKINTTFGEYEGKDQTRNISIFSVRRETAKEESAYNDERCEIPLVQSKSVDYIF
jgi:hypothetical protein